MRIEGSSECSAKDKQLLFDLLGKQKAFVLKRLKDMHVEAAE
jgi:hypothetical protein